MFFYKFQVSKFFLFYCKLSSVLNNCIPGYIYKCIQIVRKTFFATYFVCIIATYCRCKRQFLTNIISWKVLMSIGFLLVNEKLSVLWSIESGFYNSCSSATWMHVMYNWTCFLFTVFYFGASEHSWQFRIKIDGHMTIGKWAHSQYTVHMTIVKWAHSQYTVKELKPLALFHIFYNFFDDWLCKFTFVVMIFMF